MDYKCHKLSLLNSLVLLLLLITKIQAQHENIPYQNVTEICEKCICLSIEDTAKRLHQTLDCSIKNFQHILARWPKQFGQNLKGTDLVATFSGNKINLLQQLPATNATLTFSCRHCDIKQLQAPLFMDVPNIERLDLSWNAIKSDELTSDLFRGPFGTKHYEPIALIDLDLSHNQLHTLQKKLFEHTPELRKLNLAYNKFDILDGTTILALTSAVDLQILDLSYNGLQMLSDNTIFQSLNSLRELNFAGNKFNSLPGNLQLLGKHLETLNVAGNQITGFDKKSFQGLYALKRLNISDMSTLKSIGNDTFTQLPALQYLYVTHNPHLEKFNMNGLKLSRNLTLLDLSHCGLNTLEVTQTNLNTNDNITNVTTMTTITNVTSINNRTRAWPNLISFNIVGNPWYCNCDLFTTLDYAVPYHYSVLDSAEPRCETPYSMAGSKIYNLTAKQICSMQISKKYRVIDEDPPRFLRKRYVILTAIIASVVVGLGLIVGFIVVIVRRRLRGSSYGIEPIRYTSVRGSNWSSAFPHTNTHNGGTSTAITVTS